MVMYYLSIRLERLKKTTKIRNHYNRYPDQDSNDAAVQYKPETL
jgi:hypothetical protein